MQDGRGIIMSIFFFLTLTECICNNINSEILAIEFIGHFDPTNCTQESIYNETSTLNSIKPFDSKVDPRLDGRDTRISPYYYETERSNLF